MDPAKLKVVELRAELSKRGLDSKGNKPVLVERLRQALEEEKVDPKDQTETSQQSEHKFDSEDERSNSESKSSEQAKLPPRTPSRSSRPRRSTSREPSTPARTPSRRSSSRSSVSRMSPVKSIVAENVNESIAALEPIVEEVKLPISKTVAVSPEKDCLVTLKKDEPLNTPKKKIELSSQSDDQNILLHEKPELTKKIILTSLTVNTSLNLTKKDLSQIEESSKLIEEIELNKEGKLETVKEPEQHMHDSAQEITKMMVDNLDKITAEKTDPIKTVTQSKNKIIQSHSEDSENLTVSTTQSPPKQLTQSPTKPQSPKQLIPSPTKSESPKQLTTQSPTKPQSQVKQFTQSPTKPEPQSSTKLATQSSVKIITESAEMNVNEIKAECGSPKKVENPVTEVTENPNENLKNIVDSVVNEEEVESNQYKSNYELMEVDHLRDTNKTNLEDKNDIEKSEDRKRKRSPSPSEAASRPPPIARPEMEPKYDESAVLLSWYDSDLNLVIDSTDYFTASTMQGDGFNYMWAGVRASYGYNKGKVFFEARINSEFDNMSTAAGTSVSGAISADEEKMPSALRLGWSVMGTSLQLGEENFSYGYENTGKKCTNNEFIKYGMKFAKNDVIACYADFETNGIVTLMYAVNGEKQEPAFMISHAEFKNKALFPHVLSKNCSFKVNFGQEEHWSNQVLNGYQFVGKVNVNDRIAGPSRPEKREYCEVILLCGLPFSGKTAWALKHAAERPEKLYNILGTHNLIEKMKIDGVSFKETYKGRWETVVEKCTRAVTKLLDFAPSRRRNYILDQQSNVYGSAQKRKMRNFYGFHRKAVILVPSDEDFKERIAKRKKEAGGEEIRESSILEVKANLTAPTVGESFEEVVWAELGEEEGKQVIANYNAEGKTAGFGQSPEQISKRSRFDNQKDRNNRENRDHRRSIHNDRRTGGTWRGSGGWRDGSRMRGGPVRHGACYGLPTGPWRGRGGLPLPPRSGGDRRPGGGLNDRRMGNDRNRSTGAVRTGGWNAMGYQGNQHGNTGVWSVQGNWQGQSQAGWSGQQTSGGNSWSQQAWGGASNWKGYGQNNYSQSAPGYGQSSSGYGNGNWNNWSPQYYNQYWSGSGQQQQTTGQISGQTQSTAGSTANSQVLNKK